MAPGGHAAAEQDPSIPLLGDLKNVPDDVQKRFDDAQRFMSVRQGYEAFRNAMSDSPDMARSAYAQLIPGSAQGAALIKGDDMQRFTGKVVLNVHSISFNVFGPWVVYAFLFSHFMFHGLTKSVLFGGIALGFFFGYMAFRAFRRQAPPMWYGFACLAILSAVAIAAVVGEYCFTYYINPSQTLQRMESYEDVNPSLDKGQALMDAGRVYFQEGTGLDFRHAIGFKNIDQYCVVPIAKGHQQLNSYDYWAVGVNCCTGGADFSCGEHLNPYARAGLRMFDAKHVDMYKLAVQQAEATYNIQARHPLFFYWVQTPAKALEELRKTAFKIMLASLLLHFLFNLTCVCLACCLFAKMGHH
eukprot:TRINITY_DN122410_c0_g1_i1.p1 TRINITY_DN122410_c0_g1~~TRINITY_DN122410_c0_g1_i1.p1  ORF type:complete len:357 (+),score=76.01 TRINITY_DN122410_c0_g1_i1:129-1199(+)